MQKILISKILTMKSISFVLSFYLSTVTVSANNNLPLASIKTNYSPTVQNQTALKADDFSGKLDKLLTAEMAAEISGFSVSKVVKEYENKTAAIFGGEKKPPRECSYIWTNGRTRAVTVGGNIINAPYKDKVAIHSVSNTTLERFKRSYGALTAEQKQTAAKKLEEESAKSGNSSSNQKVTQVGADMITNLKAEEITGVGDAATWYVNSSELKVFVRGLIFSVVVDISDDKNVNRRKSIELATRIIQQKLI